jgi:hypothetical protein
MLPRRGLALLGAFLLPVLLAVPARGKVMLLGIDGASWNVIDPLVAAGELPNFAALLARGASADLTTVEPVLSPVVWTSIATGVAPDTHGISGFLTSRFDLRVPTVFDRLAAAGVKVGLYEYLVTWPPPSLPGGFVIPDWLRRDDSTWPADVWARAGVAPYRVDRDTAIEPERLAEDLLEEVARKPEIWLRLAERFEPQVGALGIYAVDGASHRFWREAYPDGAAGPPAEGSVLRRLMRELDRALGKIAASLGPGDVLLVFSDHGFQAGEPHSIWVGRTRPRLVPAGLDPERDGFTLIREWGALAVRVHPGPFEARDAVLSRLEEFYGSLRDAEGAPLYNVVVLDAVERPPSQRRPLLDRLRQWAYRGLARWRFGVRFEEAAHGWLVALPEEETLARVWPDGPVSLAGETLPAHQVVFREAFDGDHHPTAVFIAAGGPLRAHPQRRMLSVLDLAPLLFYLAGQPIPDDLEGALPRDWIDPAHLAAHPPRGVAAADAPALASSPAAPAAGVDDAMLERLRALGYVD